MLDIRRSCFLTILLLTFALVNSDACQADGKTATFKALRIAHAGGGLGRRTYTNSYQALNTNLQKGFIYFELDFTFTSDGQLVCMHDWKDNFERTFGIKTNRRLTLREFEVLVEKNPNFSNCTLAGLADWMLHNPTAHVITDIRDDNIKALKIIREVLPDASKRVIPQIYKPNNHDRVKHMGFDQIIWTLYRYAGNDYAVMEWAREWQDAVAITMPKTRARSKLPKALKSLRIPTYVHTVNTKREMMQFINGFGVTEIYTDFLKP